jgi:HD-like signal output (HDOD) protein
LLDQYVASALPLLYRKAVAEGTELLDAERSLLGVSHAEAGARLAELWRFPPPLWDVIAHHPYPERAQYDKTLTYLVYLADVLASRFDAGYELDRIGTGSLAEGLPCLGLQPDILSDFIAQIPWKIPDTPGYF